MSFLSSGTANPQFVSHNIHHSETDKRVDQQDAACRLMLYKYERGLLSPVPALKSRHTRANLKV